MATIAADIAVGWVWPNSSSDLAVLAAPSGSLPMEYPTPMSTIGPTTYRQRACAVRQCCNYRSACVATCAKPDSRQDMCNARIMHPLMPSSLARYSIEMISVEPSP